MSFYKYAIIDIGTLKVKTLIAHFDEDNNVVQVYASNTLTCFGCHLDKNKGIVKEEYLQKTIAELQRVKKVLEKYRVSKYRVISTHAMRRAKNKDEIIAGIKKETGFEVENISQEQEAELFYQAVMAHARIKQTKQQEFVLVDMGGGSVQLLVGNPRELKFKYLLQCGAQFLHDNFLEDPHSPSGFTRQEDLESMKEIILKELIKVDRSKGLPIIYGSSNIIDLMKAINLPLETDSSFNLHPYKTYAEHLQKFIDKVLPLSYAEREQRFPFQYGYMWGIDKAFLNIVTFADFFHSPYIIPSNANIAQGLIHSITGCN